jgi:hypothetical protein
VVASANWLIVKLKRLQEHGARMLSSPQKAKRSEMLPWLRRRRERLKRIEAEADALILDLGVEAYGEARRRERAARSDATAREWNRVALAVVRKTSERLGLDTATRIAMDADFSSLLEAFASPPSPPLPELGPVNELMRLASGNPQGLRFRLQFLGVATARGPAVIEEVDVRALDASDAIREAHAAWPPGATGFRLIDGEGREVFGREKAYSR